MSAGRAILWVFGFCLYDGASLLSLWSSDSSIGVLPPSTLQSSLTWVYWSFLAIAYLFFLFIIYCDGLLDVLVLLLYGNNYEICANCDDIERRFSEVRREFSVPSWLLTGVLVGIGLFMRAAWAETHGVSFSSMNTVENLVFGAFLLVPTLLGLACIHSMGLSHVHELSRRILLHCTHRATYQGSLAEKLTVLSQICSDRNMWALNRRPSPQGEEGIRGEECPRNDAWWFKGGLDIAWRFVRAEGLSIAGSLGIPAGLMVLPLAWLTGHVAYYDHYLHGEVQYWIRVGTWILLFGLMFPLLLGNALTRIAVPEGRKWGIWLLIVIVGGLFLPIAGEVWTDIIDRIPQQLGGFKPEGYIAIWKCGDDIEIMPDEYCQKVELKGESTLSQEGKRKAPTLVKIRIAYKSDKYFFIPPLSDAVKKKCIMIRADCFEFLGPKSG